MFKPGNKACEQLRRARWPLLRTCPFNLGNGRNKWACDSFAWMKAEFKQKLVLNMGVGETADYSR